jgi:hypothetical protein
METISLGVYESLAGLRVSPSPDGVGVGPLSFSVHRMSSLFQRGSLPVATIALIDRFTGTVLSGTKRDATRPKGEHQEGVSQRNGSHEVRPQGGSHGWLPTTRVAGEIPCRVKNWWRVADQAFRGLPRLQAMARD